jgi:hypothetical protein
MKTEKQYIGTYKVYRIFRVSRRREIIKTGLTREDAMRIVNSYPDSSRSMVVFDKQFTADKYYV